MILGPEDLGMQVKADLMKQFKCDDSVQLEEYVGNKIDMSEIMLFVQWEDAQ
jgi:hypothetical protein